MVRPFKGSYEREPKGGVETTIPRVPKAFKDSLKPFSWQPKALERPLKRS
jgi:hypothetical protein